MSYWDSKNQKIVRFEPKPYEGYPGWLVVDCGCCNGIEWSSGDTPNECSTCDGNGWIAKHIQSGVLALYPGGPLKGKEDSTHAK